MTFLEKNGLLLVSFLEIGNTASALIDFELGIKNAFVAVFPAVSVNGCFFHFTQNIWRKMQQHGLQVRYQAEPGFVIEARMIAALAFVPGVDIDQVFDHDLDIILDYIEDNSIGAYRRGHNRAPRFAYDMWGVTRSKRVTSYK